MDGVVWVKGTVEPTEFQPPALGRDATHHISLLRDFIFFLKSYIKSQSLKIRQTQGDKVRFPRVASQTKATANPFHSGPGLTLGSSSRSRPCRGRRRLWEGAGWGRCAARSGSAPPPSAAWPAGSGWAWGDTREQEPAPANKMLPWKTTSELSQPSTAQDNSQSYKYLYELPLLLGNFGAIIMRTG